MENRFTPLSELLYENVQDYPEGSPIAFRDVFPRHVPLDKIGIDLQKAHRLCNLGGIWRVSITGSSDNDTSKVTPEISGFSGSNTAYSSGKKHDEEMPPYGKEIRPIYMSNAQPFSNTWAALEVDLNFNEINQRILNNKGYGNSRSESAWADFLNDSVTSSIRNSGTGFLLKGLNSFQCRSAVDNYLFFLMGSFIPDVMFLATRGELGINLFYNFGFALTLGAIQSCAKGSSFEEFSQRLHSILGSEHGFPDVHLSDYRFSLSGGPQLDRAILLQIASRRGRLIQPI